MNTNMSANCMYTKLKADYVEQANKYLDTIPVKNSKDFEAIQNFLINFFENKGLVKVACYKELTEDQKRNIKILEGMIIYPEDYVQEEKHYGEFKDIVLNRVAAKIAELQTISLQEKEALIKAQGKSAQEKTQKQDILSKAKAPEPGSEAHTISEKELLREMQERLRRPAAVRQDSYALQFASETLRNDREIVLAAVQQDGRALEYGQSRATSRP